MSKHSNKQAGGTATVTEEDENEENARPVIYTWENSYRMQPTKKFKPHLVKLNMFKYCMDAYK